MTALVIGPAERLAIADLVTIAAGAVVDVGQLGARLRTRDGKLAHMVHMTRQTILLPEAWLVTYSIETGHPGGRFRHLSVSVEREGRMPGPEAVWMIAECFGFQGSLAASCKVYLEQLRGRAGAAVNVLQPFPS